MAATAERDPFDGRLGRVYDAYIKRPALARVIGRALWSADTSAMYELMGAVGRVPDNSTVIDAPCGGGLAFRELRPEQRIRYLALDLSSQMVERARREAGRRGLSQIELLRGDVKRMPFEDGTADLTLSMNSLHCVPGPAAAVAELARVTRPGAPLIGSMLVFGGGRRPDRALRHGQRDGSVADGGTAEDLRRWLVDAGLEDVRVEASGAIAVFESRRQG